MQIVMLIKIGASKIRLQKKKKGSSECMITAITTTCHQEEESAGLVHNYCLRCGRKLKNDRYKKLGYGPVCLKKIEQNKFKKLF